MSTLKSGTLIRFTKTGKEFKLEKVTDKRVSWYVGFEFKGGSGKNIMRMTSTSLRLAEKWVSEGAWIILN